jgi:hypothetical protein
VGLAKRLIFKSRLGPESPYLLRGLPGQTLLATIKFDLLGIDGNGVCFSMCFLQPGPIANRI